MSISSDSSPRAERLRLRLILPFPLPTHNQLNALGLRDRMKVKKFIRDTVSVCIRNAGGEQIPMGSVLKPRSMGLYLAGYLETIRRTGYQKRRRNLKKSQMLRKR